MCFFLLLECDVVIEFFLSLECVVYFLLCGRLFCVVPVPGFSVESTLTPGTGSVRMTLS
jgi:hypothetical protein